MKAPVEVGEVVEVEIISVGEKGDGIAKIQGFVIIIPGTQIGDVVSVRIMKLMQKLAFAEKIE